MTNLRKCAFGCLVAVLFAACFWGLIQEDRRLNTEADNDYYNRILYLAKNCKRDKCDAIIDALEDQAITLYEAGSILRLTNKVAIDENIDAKNLLIEYVNNNDKFRKKF